MAGAEKKESFWKRHLVALIGFLIVVGRSVRGMRFGVNASMGLSDMPYRRFLPWSVLSRALWSAYTCALAYRAPPRVEQVRR